MSLRWKIAQFFELRWWLRYLSDKDKTTYLDWKKAYWRQFLSETGLNLPTGAKVLDAGCGPAGIFTILSDCQVDAVDPLINSYQQRLPHFNATDYLHTRFFAQTIESFYPDATYDFVFCLNALNHVADLQQSLDRLAAWTIPGGVLVISVDAHHYPILKRIFQLIPGDILHPHQYDLREYEGMLQHRGFSIEKRDCLKQDLIFDYWRLVATR